VSADARRRTVSLRLVIRNKSRQPVRLSQPAPPLIQGGGHIGDLAPDPKFAAPLIVRAGRRWGKTNWAVTPLGAAGKTFRIKPQGSVTLPFRIDVPANEKLNKTINLRYEGRARWGAFESTFQHQHTPVVAPQAATGGPGKGAR